MLRKQKKTGRANYGKGSEQAEKAKTIIENEKQGPFQFVSV